MEDIYKVKYIMWIIILKCFLEYEFCKLMVLFILVFFWYGVLIKIVVLI